MGSVGYRFGVSDEEVAGFAERGDTQAFGELVRRYETRLLRYARRFLLRADAEDAVQEAFLKAYANIRSFDTRRRFSPWIYRIAHNEFVNVLKRRGVETVPVFDFDTLFPHLVSRDKPEDQAERAELRRLLDNSLQALNVKYRAPLVLYYFEELEYKDIADVLGVPIATVGVRLRRGRNALRKLVEKNTHHTA